VGVAAGVDGRVGAVGVDPPHATALSEWPAFVARGLWAHRQPCAVRNIKPCPFRTTLLRVVPI